LRHYTLGINTNLPSTVDEVIRIPLPPVLVQYGPNVLSIVEGEPWEVCLPNSGASSVCDRGVDEAGGLLRTLTLLTLNILLLLRASESAFTLNMSHVGTSELGSSACSQ